MFYRSLLSDWNHRNAHFLRGVVTELMARGHEVRVYEPRCGLDALVADQGTHVIRGFQAAYPLLGSERYVLDTLDLDRALDGVDLVLVHEYTDPEVVRRLGERRAAGGSFRLLFHDTHHRAISDPAALAAYDLQHYDGVLAIGDLIRDTYIRESWAANAWTWHEAADTRVFHPIEWYPKRGDLVWVGNWAGEAGAAEFQEFLLEPVRTLELHARIHGVGYDEAARAALQASGIEYGGWIPNYAIPELFARYRVTVHFPRRPYISALPGVPSIRVFEALACGIPLVSACQDDVEGLFTPGQDYLVARNGSEMKKHLRALVHDDWMASEIAENGWKTVLTRHTCAHRVDELLAVAGSMGLDTGEPLVGYEGWSETVA